MAAAPPPNFSWVEPQKLAGLGMPRITAHYQFLLNNGIKHLITLSERKPPYHDNYPELTLHHIRIYDFCAPTFDQIKLFLSIVEEANSKGEGVAVHCLHGFGRTGTMLACYLVKSRKISGIDAINEIRKIRHGSIETREQEQMDLSKKSELLPSGSRYRTLLTKTIRNRNSFCPQAITLINNSP